VWFHEIANSTEIVCPKQITPTDIDFIMLTVFIRFIKKYLNLFAMYLHLNKYSFFSNQVAIRKWRAGSNYQYHVQWWISTSLSWYSRVCHVLGHLDASAVWWHALNFLVYQLRDLPLLLRAQRNEEVILF